MYISEATDSTLVAINGHKAISLVVGIRARRTVHWDLLEVGAQTMTMGVIVGVETTLRWKEREGGREGWERGRY